MQNNEPKAPAPSKQEEVISYVEPSLQPKPEGEGNKKIAQQGNRESHYIDYPLHKTPSTVKNIVKEHYKEAQKELATTTTSSNSYKNSSIRSHVKPVGEKQEIVSMQEEQTVIISTSSKGAIIVLSLGLVISALLLFFVGCRLRTVKRRLRKGRPLNSNEADYLINGMYL